MCHSTRQPLQWPSTKELLVAELTKRGLAHLYWMESTNYDGEGQVEPQFLTTSINHLG